MIECLQALNLLLREALTDPSTRRGDKPDLMVVSLQDKIFANVQEEYFKDQSKWRSIWLACCHFTSSISSLGPFSSRELSVEVFLERERATDYFRKLF